MSNHRAISDEPGGPCVTCGSPTTTPVHLPDGSPHPDYSFEQTERDIMSTRMTDPEDCRICWYEEVTLESFPHYPCGPDAELGERFIETEPPQWGDSAWWRSTNTIRDVGEQYALARREANRIRHADAGHHRSLHPGEATTMSERREGIPAPSRMSLAWRLLWNGKHSPHLGENEQRMGAREGLESMGPKALLVACPACKSPAGEPCRSMRGPNCGARVYPHLERHETGEPWRPSLAPADGFYGHDDA